MPTRLVAVAFDAPDTSALARFWSALTGWPVTVDEPGEAVVEPPRDESGTPTEPGILLVFVQADDAKVAKNRVHLDLASRSPEHQAELVERARRAGAAPLDIGQGAVPWVVLADPGGNEFCVLEPRDDYADAGVVAAVVVDTHDPGALAPFWSEATGWPVLRKDLDAVRLSRTDGAGPHLELLRVDEPAVAGNRVHLGIAPRAGDDLAAEIARLSALGATPARADGSEQTWVELLGAHGDELCVVLRPRG